MVSAGAVVDVVPIVVSVEEVVAMLSTEVVDWVELLSSSDDEHAEIARAAAPIARPATPGRPTRRRSPATNPVPSTRNHPQRSRPLNGTINRRRIACKGLARNRNLRPPCSDGTRKRPERREERQSKPEGPSNLAPEDNPRIRPRSLVSILFTIYNGHRGR